MIWLQALYFVVMLLLLILTCIGIVFMIGSLTEPDGFFGFMVGVALVAIPGWLWLVMYFAGQENDWSF